MDPDLPDLTIADVVISTAGRDAGKLFYVLEADDTWLTLVNGKHCIRQCIDYDALNLDYVVLCQVVNLLGCSLHFSAQISQVSS